MVRFLLILLLFSFSAQAKERPQLTLTQSAETVWQRQQVLITLEVKTDDPFSRLEVDLFEQKGLSIVPYEQQRIENKDHVLLTMKWAIFSFIPGKQTLQLPEVVYRPNGGRKIKLDLQALSLQVKRLPVYVSPTMPVGKITLKNEWYESWLVTPNNLLSWKIQVEGEGVAQQTMPPISRQITNNKSLQFLPTKKDREIRLLDKGITNQFSYHIPLKANKSGMLDFPAIKVQYFEPVSGKLQTTKLSPPLVLSLNKWLLGIIIVLLFLGILILFFVLFKIFKQLYVKSIQRKKALKQLTEANSYLQIREAINQISLSHDWDDNLSLSMFLAHWERKFGKSSPLEKTIEQLQAQQFSAFGSQSIKEISKSLHKYIKH